MNVLSEAVLMALDLPGTSLMSCGRLFQQITHHLAMGAAIVVVDAQGPEQQLGVSRVLLESKCDMLLTHDGPTRTPTDHGLHGSTALALRRPV